MSSSDKFKTPAKEDADIAIVANNDGDINQSNMQSEFSPSPYKTDNKSF